MANAYFPLVPYFFVFFLGLIIGSFLNCLIYRLETGKSFLKERSFCPHCKHILSWKDLIPVLSFIFLKGKCRYCHKKISLQYPLVELSTAISFLFPLKSIQNYITLYSSIEVIFYWLVFCFLIVIFVFDLKQYIIPDKVIYPAIVITFFYRLFERLEFRIFKPFLLSAILVFGFFLLIILISQGKWMGWGDLKLGILMGLFLGWPKILVALFLAFFIGAIIGLGLIILGKKTMKSEIPFAPFLVTATFLALFFGEKIIDWYLKLFLI